MNKILLAVLAVASDENVYQECMEIVLKERGVEFEPQKKLPLKYKGKTLRHFYQPDLFCFGKIIVELKASAAIPGSNAFLVFRVENPDKVA